MSSVSSHAHTHAHAHTPKSSFAARIVFKDTPRTTQILLSISASVECPIARSFLIEEVPLHQEHNWVGKNLRCEHESEDHVRIGNVTMYRGDDMMVIQDRGDNYLRYVHPKKNANPLSREDYSKYDVPSTLAKRIIDSIDDRVRTSSLSWLTSV